MEILRRQNLKILWEEFWTKYQICEDKNSDRFGQNIKFIRTKVKNPK